MGVRPCGLTHSRPRESKGIQKGPPLKLRSMISESPSGRLVAWNLEGLAAAGSLSWFCTFFLLADLYETFLFC